MIAGTGTYWGDCEGSEILVMKAAQGIGFWVILTESSSV